MLNRKPNSLVALAMVLAVPATFPASAKACWLCWHRHHHAASYGYSSGASSRTGGGSTSNSNNPVDNSGTTQTPKDGTGQGLTPGTGESGALAGAVKAGLHQLRPGLAAVLDTLLKSDLGNDDQRMLMALVREYIDADLRHESQFGPSVGGDDYAARLREIERKYELLGGEIDTLHAKLFGDPPPIPPTPPAADNASIDAKIDAKLTRFKSDLTLEIRDIIRAEMKSAAEPTAPPATPATGGLGAGGVGEP